MVRPPSTAPLVPAIDVRALSKLHGSTAALLDVTFSVAPGHLVAVLGAPGSGKTTLLKLLVGHVTPTGGRVRVEGIDLRAARLALTGRIGYVSQFRIDLGTMRPLDVLEFGARARQIPPQQLEGRLEQVTAVCELDGELRAPFRRLSTLGRARVALAQALMHEPSVLLLDELLTGLDDGGILAIVRVLERLRGGITLVVSGAPGIDAALAADRSLQLEGGRLASDSVLADRLVPR